MKSDVEGLPHDWLELKEALADMDEDVLIALKRGRCPDRVRRCICVVERELIEAELALRHADRRLQSNRHPMYTSRAFA